jgi:hypothetical protein
MSNSENKDDDTNDIKDSLLYFVKELFNLDRTAIIIFGIMICWMLCFNMPQKCDKIFKENSQKRHLQQILIDDVKNYKHAKIEDRISNVQTILSPQSQSNAINLTETDVGFVCKIIYPLTTRGITNDEDISTALIIKSTLFLYLIIKSLSLLLQAVGLSIFIDSLISLLYCYVAMWSAGLSTKGKAALEKALEKKRKLIEDLKQFGTSKTIRTARVEKERDKSQKNEKELRYKNNSLAIEKNNFEQKNKDIRFVFFQNIANAKDIDIKVQFVKKINARAHNELDNTYLLHIDSISICRKDTTDYNGEVSEVRINTSKTNSEESSQGYNYNITNNEQWKWCIELLSCTDLPQGKELTEYIKKNFKLKPLEPLEPLELQTPNVWQIFNPTFNASFLNTKDGEEANKKAHYRIFKIKEEEENQEENFRKFKEELLKITTGCR